MQLHEMNRDAKVGVMKMEQSRIVSSVVGILLVYGLQVGARTLQGLPEPIFADTEVSTNVAMRAWTERTRMFNVVVSFDATPSNNVQAAFGADASADGILSGPDERRPPRQLAQARRVRGRFLGIKRN